MPKTRSQKTATLDALTEAFRTGKSAAFADFQGMTVGKMTDLRKQLFNEQVDYVVAKKTLLSLAAKQAGYDVNFKSFPGMVSVAFANADEMAPAKLLGEAGKDGQIKLLGGIFEGAVVDQPYVTRLSKLPSRSQLLGQLLNVMNGPMSSFARLLNSYKEKQGSASA